MNAGLSFAPGKHNKDELQLSVELAALTGDLTLSNLQKAFEQSDYGDWFYDQQAAETACEQTNKELKEPIKPVISFVIAECKDASVSFSFTEENMRGSAIIETASGGKPITVEQLIEAAKDFGIKKGLNKKQLKSVAKKQQDANPGTLVEIWIAKGKAAIDGKDSVFKQLVPCIKDRILRPADNKSMHKVDMRDLGPMVSVKKGELLMRRLPPTKATAGFKVNGEAIEGKDGEVLEFDLKEGVEVSEKDADLIVAARLGMPKFSSRGAEVDETLNVKEVSLKTGHLEYKGGIVCNGNVAEKMRIKADGDITISGTVDSAVIIATGDVFIAQGALGKRFEDSEGHFTDFSCHIHAGGDVYIQHAQGVNIHSGGNVIIQRQLAYSKVRSAKSIVIGDEKAPMGAVFASDLYATEAVHGGTLGASSESVLSIVFSDVQGKLTKKQKIIADKIAEEQDVMLRIQEKLILLQNRIRGGDKVDIGLTKKLYKEYKKRRSLIRKLNLNNDQLQQKIDQEKPAQIVTARKKLYPKVAVNSGRISWRNDTEYGASQVKMDENGRWDREPLS